MPKASLLLLLPLLAAPAAAGEWGMDVAYSYHSGKGRDSELTICRDRAMYHPYKLSGPRSRSLDLVLRVRLAEKDAGELKRVMVPEFWSLKDEYRGQAQPADESSACVNVSFPRRKSSCARGGGPPVYEAIVGELGRLESRYFPDGAQPASPNAGYVAIQRLPVIPFSSAHKVSLKALVNHDLRAADGKSAKERFFNSLQYRRIDASLDRALEFEGGGVLREFAVVRQGDRFYLANWDHRRPSFVLLQGPRVALWPQGTPLGVGRSVPTEATVRGPVYRRFKAAVARAKTAPGMPAFFVSRNGKTAYAVVLVPIPEGAVIAREAVCGRR